MPGCEMIGVENKGRRRLYWIAVVLALVVAVACSGGTETGGDGAGSGAVQVGQTGDFQEGKTLFNDNCAVCHGAAGIGTQVGPPLVHPIYKPDHHPDFAFRNAVNSGVEQHHWAFGNMPPRPGLSEGDVDNIICYIRQLQVDEGIHEGEAC